MAASARPSKLKRVTELAIASDARSYCLAPQYCDTKVVVAMVRPETIAISEKIIGPFTEIAARA